jgi:hypothetical protein
MSIVPLDLQRKCERRWAARFSRPPAVPQARIGLKARVTPLPQSPNPKEKAGGRYTVGFSLRLPAQVRCHRDVAKTASKRLTKS